MSFGEKYIYYNKEDWKRVIFSDETMFNLVYSDSPATVWKKKGRKIEWKNVVKTIKLYGGCIMCWGCFSYSGVGNLVFIEGNMDQFMYVDILKENLESYAKKLNLDDFTFQQDNESNHTAKLIKHYFLSQGINVLDWPSQSPDYNPIENLWAYIEKRLSKEKKRKRNKNEKEKS